MNIRNHPYHQKGEFLIDTQLQMDFLKNITWILYFAFHLTYRTLFCSSLVTFFEAITIPMLRPFFKISHMVSLFLIKSTNRNNGKIILVTPFLGEVKQK